MSHILSRTRCPADLQQLTGNELKQLAAEIRDVLIRTTAKNGGHLAPNLGVVELTLALHLVFSTPLDKIVWDVGHQSYVHKLLTGRQDNFSSLRSYRGMAGFPKRAESIHDAFGTGHSSTSISAATGLAFARDLKKEPGAVVAVIGDGAMTGGMAFEALNYAGQAETDLIVVLNDNEMSIANNVGGLATYLTRMRTDPRYFRGKEDIEELVKRTPIGPQVLKVLERLKDGLKQLVVPGMLFEELGFTYLGPIDGHNLPELRQVFTNARRIKGPVLVHVLTKKGKGYQPAEENPDVFHGVGAFDIPTGKPLPKNGAPAYTKVFSDALIELAGRDDRIIGITAAMPDGTGMTPFSQAFPGRFFDVGIAEQHAVTMAAALALQGFRPVVAIYSTFLQRAYDQVLHDVCLQKAPVVFAIDRAGLVGEDGETHQGLFDFSFLRHIPGIVLMAPKDENELRHMLCTALNHPGPIALRYPRGAGLGVTLDPVLQELPIGKAEYLRQGRDLAILAIGNMVQPALTAAEKLAENGVQAAVVNVRFVKPLDEELILDLAAKTGRLITVEENMLAGGFGGAVLELLSGHTVNCQVKRLGIPDIFVPHGATGILRDVYGLTADHIAQAAGELLTEGKAPNKWGRKGKGPLAAVKIVFRGDAG
ncbi:MAG: 1-deoxy-D-xylulose-5-phosphate synthase [Heliobacteriaceae bacterium]|nr:1-deoxy-D-xylulose-5-phosphate synthase [Heliobacteriaceae bacterium]MDD4587279.1 1-deoxy-D-xylulose-5-phosphate synthase [Heliobacteriaceae bacterium]